MGRGFTQGDDPWEHVKDMLQGRKGHAGVTARDNRLTIAEVEAILTDLAQHAIVLAPVSTPAAPPAPDPGGQLLWELLTARADLVLVTGDKLLRAAGMRGRVISPRAFVSGTDRGNNAP